MADIKIQGADALVRSLRKRVGHDKVNQVVKRNTANAQRIAMRHAAVDTGFMRRSINIELQPYFLSGAIVAMAEYSPYIEYGTRFNSGPRPFMRVARNEVYSPFMSDLRKLLKNG